MKTFLSLGVLLSLFGGVGCAAAIPPPELVSARAAYDRAAHGPAAQLDPTDLHTARESLDEAERSFNDLGDTPDTRDLGYTAERRTEMAETRARTMGAIAARDQIVAQMHASTENRAVQATAELGQANQALTIQGAQLKAAEQRAAQARADLARFASVKQDPRGMVITLSGSVLFVSNKSDLLPEAQLKLNDVANALTKQDPESTIEVDGFTDSQGMAASNQDLSMRRAESVRAYLVSRGIAADRLSAAGFGATRPIADNGSAEGRADNRRVEIIVKPAH